MAWLMMMFITLALRNKVRTSSRSSQGLLVWEVGEAGLEFLSFTLLMTPLSVVATIQHRPLIFWLVTILEIDDMIEDMDAADTLSYRPNAR